VKEQDFMEALILTSAVLALARLLTKKSGGESSSTTEQPTTPPAIVRDPPPPPPPSRPSDGVQDRARLDRARALAVQVAQLIKAHGRAYNHDAVAAFQREAGLVADGIYGPRTAGAVKWYTGESIPPLSGRGFEAYAPFGSLNTKAADASPSISPQKQTATTPTTPPRKPATQTTPPQKPATTQTTPSQKPTTQTPPARKPEPATAPKETKPPAPPVHPSDATPKTAQPGKPATAESPKDAGQRDRERATTAPTVPGLPDREQLDRTAGLAKQVADSVKKGGKGYDRALVTAFQKEAGLAADGIYGPRTAGAVKWYTGESIAPPTGGGFASYVPKLGTSSTQPKAEPKRPEPKAEPSPQTPAPTSTQQKTPEPSTGVARDGARLDRAAELAKRVAANLKGPANAYDRALMTEFQREAGLTADGIYGPRSAGAVKWYTGESIRPKTGRGFVQYVPNY
jgi:peptidoglycan hydrolase-like protein with peptidoglycan-binding domain